MTPLNIDNNIFINEPSIYFEMLINVKTTEYSNFLFTRITVDNENINHQCYKTGKTLLMYAVENNNYEYVNNLLNKGAYLDIIDNKGQMARNYAINNKNWTLNYILYNKENENINIRNIEYPDDLCISFVELRDNSHH